MAKSAQPTKSQDEMSRKLLAYRIAQREEEKAHAKSFPVPPEEASRFASTALAKQLALLEDRELARDIGAEIADFAGAFSVKIERIEARLTKEHLGEPGGIYRLGFRKDGELRLMLRKGLYGPRVQVTLSFPAGSSAWHRYDRIDGILKELREADLARKTPRFATIKDPLTFVRESTKGVSADELKRKKQERIERCLAYIGKVHARGSFKLMDIIRAMLELFPQEFATEHYARAALEQMYKQADAYAEPVTKGRSGIYRLTDLGWRTATDLMRHAASAARPGDAKSARPRQGLTGAPADLRA